MSMKRAGFADLKSRILSLEYSDREIIERIAEDIDLDCQGILKKERPYLTTEQILDLIKKGFTIGAHSVDHPNYGTLSLEEQISTTLESIRTIKQKFNLGYGVFAFPFSDSKLSDILFERINQGRLADATFGNGGIRDGIYPRHFVRFSLDNPNATVTRMIALQQAKRLLSK